MRLRQTQRRYKVEPGISRVVVTNQGGSSVHYRVELSGAKVGGQRLSKLCTTFAEAQQVKALWLESKGAPLTKDDDQGSDETVEHGLLAYCDDVETRRVRPDDEYIAGRARPSARAEQVIRVMRASMRDLLAMPLRAVTAKSLLYEFRGRRLQAKKKPSTVRRDLGVLCAMLTLKRPDLEIPYLDLLPPKDGTRVRVLDMMDETKVFVGLLESDTRPSRAQKLITHNGTTQSVAAWAQATGIPASALYARLANGWTVERALTVPRADCGPKPAARAPRTPPEDSSRFPAYPVFRIAALTMLRLWTVLTLRREHVDLALGYITLPVTKTTPKPIPLGVEAVEILREQIATLPDDCPWVFPNRKTWKPYRTTSASRVWRLEARRAGISTKTKSFTVHDLRHHGAVVGYNVEGANRQDVKTLGGWSRDDQMERYAVVADGRLRAVANGISRGLRHVHRAH